MSKNTNRDYLIIVDVKSSAIREFNKLEFYINDKESHNIFVQLVIKESHDVINKYAPIDDPNLYELAMNIVKPTNEHKRITGELMSLEDGLYEFKLPQDCCDKVGTYVCELETIYNSRVTNSNNIKYRVKKSVLNDLDNIVDAPGYPIVIQLLDKLSDIEQYEEDRRTNELARQLAEEQRQIRYDELAENMEGKITSMDNKITDVEDRVQAKEQAVDKLIVDTKKDIDDYKVAKDTEIDEYKALKDTEINNAIANQDNKIDEAISNQNDRITVVENNVVAQNGRLDALENKDTLHESRLKAIETKNTEQDGRLDVAENRLANIGNDITNTMQPIIDEHTSRLDNIEAIDVAQNSRLDAIEVKNQQQDDRLLDIEKVNKKQEQDIRCLYGFHENTIDITEEGNSIYLQNSVKGYCEIDNIQGNTLVNCNKEPNKQLILNGNINTSGDNSVTITEGVDGGLVDVALEGNTMVNVCDQKDPVAITKSYTVETGNHVALQGEYDGKCRPVVNGNTLVNLFDKSINWRGSAYKQLLLTKVTNGTFTFKAEIGDKSSNTSDAVLSIRAKNKNDGTERDLYATYSNSHGNLNLVFTLSEEEYLYFNNYDIVDDKFYKNYPKPLILEGDYTNKPIPEYFEGLQSSFEDNLVTQEMVDNGEEVADNLGKYKVKYKVAGKNKFDKSKTLDGYEIAGTGIRKHDGWFVTDFIPVIPNTSYSISGKSNGDSVLYYNNNKQLLETGKGGGSFITAPENARYVRLNGQLTQKNTFQIEEGNTATAYEPYKEYTKTLYLNSPLLEGDTIEERNGGIYHVHKSELVAYTEGDEASLITDKVNTLHQLAAPTYELIEQSNLAIPSYTNGYLDFNTAVPVEKVEFKPFEEELTYLYANTQYTVQFIADKVTTADITLGGTQLLAQSIVKGLNRMSITTPATLSDNKLLIDGVGANISEVVVTDTNREFMYFEGMKSVGECEHNVIEILLQNKNLVQNIVLGGINNTTSVLTDGDATVRSETHILVKPNTEYTINNDLLYDNYIYEYDINKNFIKLNKGRDNPYTFTTTNNTYYITFRSTGNREQVDLNVKYQIEEGSMATDYTPHQSNTQTLTHEPLRAVGDYKDRYVMIDGMWFIKKECGIRAYQEGDEDNYKTDLVNTVYPLEMPTYEEIDYNPLEVYSDITHITTNSTIPTNITVKNHGYNCLLKPSTTYTVSSNLGLNTVTTPSVLTEDCLRFMDTDTSDITTMKDVLVLEGDWTTKSDLIPANFSGIESAFEQEYDEEKGKYKVKIRVQNEDASKENYIEFYINEPLRGVGDVKDKVYVKDNKVVVERKCGARAYQDGDFGTYPTDKVNTVYPLSEPIYEEVEYNGVKLLIETFKNSTLSYNSNVAVTSTVRYSYSVPLVDTVAQTASISDQQDSMIIDLATQVAVMEMMLM